MQQFLEAVGEGNYIETAAKLAGITKQSVYEWIKRGQSGEPGTEAFRVFADAVEKAEARAEAKMLANVRRASELPQFWAAGMTVLERRHPDRWGKRQDDSTQPKVVVNIGVGSGDVRVGVLSPSNPQQLEGISTGQVEMLSPIRENYVNQPAELAAGQIPAVESEGGPSHPGGGAQVASRGLVRQRVRRGAGKGKKAGGGL